MGGAISLKNFRGHTGTEKIPRVIVVSNINIPHVCPDSYPKLSRMSDRIYHIKELKEGKKNKKRDRKIKIYQKCLLLN